MDKAQAKPTEKLLTEFIPPTYEEWKQAVEAMLKGKPFEKAMFTKTYEDIVLKPIYRQEDVENLPHLGDLPGALGSARSSRISGYLKNSWAVAQEQTDYLPEEVNASLMNELNRGLTKVNLRVDYPSAHGKNPQKLTGENRYRGTSITTLEDLRLILKDVAIEHIEIDINAGIMAPAYLSMLKALAEERKIETNLLSGCIGLDPLAVLVTDGKLETDLEQTLNYMACMTDWAVKHAPKMKTILVDTTSYGDNGATITQELAIAFNTATFYVNALQERGLKLADIFSHIQFNMTIGSHFFMEIAKFRAFRILWHNFITAYDQASQVKAYVHAKTSAWNKTKYDAFVNILRTSTETFSAVLGGIDSLQITHLDELVARPSQFTRRVARNQQIIIDEETNMNRLIDPAGGSWYIESMTAEIAEKAWEVFQTYEAEGGILVCLQNDLIQDDVTDVAELKMKNVGSRQDVIVGTNMFANLEEKKIDFDEADLDKKIEARIAKIYKFVEDKDKAQAAKCSCSCDNKCDCSSEHDSHILDEISQFFIENGTIAEVYANMWKISQPLEITPLIKQRATSKIEDLRAKVENAEVRPSVFLANYGPLAQFKPRADFSKGFFEVGAYEVLNNLGFTDVDKMIKAALDSQAKIVCICSTDEAYQDFVVEFTSKLKEKNSQLTVILAGYPKEQIASYQEAGVDDFIHLKANCYAVLNSLWTKVGVK
ncbi:methylmalonyl-CoA mutase small subunit [bacterium]|nr:methylmalonyl-CoA mutase small subunit [bacterium]